jgi:hypothetical protein
MPTKGEVSPPASGCRKRRKRKGFQLETVVKENEIERVSCFFFLFKFVS